MHTKFVRYPNIGFAVIITRPCDYLISCEHTYRRRRRRRFFLHLYLTCEQQCQQENPVTISLCVVNGYLDFICPPLNLYPNNLSYVWDNLSFFMLTFHINSRMVLKAPHVQVNILVKVPEVSTNESYSCLLSALKQTCVIIQVYRPSF